MRWAALALVLSCAALVALPRVARAQSHPADDARLAPVRNRLAAAIEAAQREGLPSEWLLDKIAEGLSKRVPPERIAAAVDALLERIRIADELVRPIPNAARDHRRLLRAALDALTAGAPHEPLGHLVREIVRSERAHASERVREALTTVAELTERQFGGEAAVDAAREAYRQGRGRGLGDLLQRARRIARDPPGGRDRALRELGREVGRGARGIDRASAGGDHARDAHRGRGPR